MTLTLTEKEKMLEEGQTSERVSFTCPGCGRDTTIHVGLETFLPDKRCLLCRGSLRFGRGTAQAPVKGRKVGTHEGRIKDPERRAVKKAAAARNRSRRAGMRAKNGTTYRPGCNTYEECHHRKHSVPRGR